MKAIVCDMDHILVFDNLNIDDEICQKLIYLQKHGIQLIITSQQSLQPLKFIARQLQMHRYGGLIIGCNGSFIYHMQQQRYLDRKEIKKEDAISMWEFCQKYEIAFAIEQSDMMLATQETKGFLEDQALYQIPYYYGISPKNVIYLPIGKCCISDEKEILDIVAQDIQAIATSYTCRIVRKSDTIIDIYPSIVSKYYALEKVYQILNIALEDMIYIGFDESDALCIDMCGLGVTFEDGDKACKEVAKEIIPQQRNNGLLYFLEHLITVIGL